MDVSRKVDDRRERLDKNKIKTGCRSPNTAKHLGMSLCVRLRAIKLTERQHFAELVPLCNESTANDSERCSSIEFYRCISLFHDGEIERSLRCVELAIADAHADRMCAHCVSADCLSEYRYTLCLRQNALAQESLAWQQTLQSVDCADASTRYRIGLALLATLNSYLLVPTSTAAKISTIQRFALFTVVLFADCGFVVRFELAGQRVRGVRLRIASNRSGSIST
jgi:hypothetical protein